MVEPNWDSYAELGILQAVIDPRDHQGFKNQLIDQVQWSMLDNRLVGIRHLLDFGCGTGRFANRIRNLGIQYSGIDTSKNMVNIAEKNHPFTDCQFAQFDGLEIPFPNAFFDVCLSCGVLQYLIKGENSQKVLSEIYRVLNPNGRLILIEQVSQSNQTSGLGMRALTEEDYFEELSNLFIVGTIDRVRAEKFSRFARLILRGAKFSPPLFGRFLKRLAQFEVDFFQKLPHESLSNFRYYDILIEAVKKDFKQPVQGISNVS